MAELQLYIQGATEVQHRLKIAEQEQQWRETVQVQTQCSAGAGAVQGVEIATPNYMDQGACSEQDMDRAYTLIKAYDAGMTYKAIFDGLMEKAGPQHMLRMQVTRIVEIWLDNMWLENEEQEEERAWELAHDEEWAWEHEYENDEVAHENEPNMFNAVSRELSRQLYNMDSWREAEYYPNPDN
jgi:hypothetical protein